LTPFAGATPIRQIIRYVVLGGANTVVSTLAFFGLSYVLPVAVAYSVVYLAALVLLVIATPRFVFGRKLTLPRSIALLLWYVAVYGLGLEVIRVLHHDLSLDRWLVTLGTVLITSPISFVGTRLITVVD